MTKKDYEAIARILATNSPQDADPKKSIRALVVSSIAQQFCGVFAADNPRFDRARFLKACGVQS